MHGCVAILPAFSSDEYYTDRASSTMGAALISATPLIATPEMLRVYRCARAGCCDARLRMGV